MAASSPDPALVAALRAAGCVFAEDEAALLEAEAAPGELPGLLARRVAGEPLEQVLGWAAFGGHRVLVAPGVFVPRRRTEAMARLAVRLLADGPEQPLVVDLCCGTGALGVVLAAELPAAEVHAADLDPAAVVCARRNLPAASVHEGDLFEALPAALRGRLDLVACNAPYVPTGRIADMPPEARDHEHRVALDGGPDGLDLHRRVAAQASAWLAPGGVLLLEAGEDQAAASAAACRAGGLVTEVVSDPEAWSTVVVARRPLPPAPA